MTQSDTAYTIQMYMAKRLTIGVREFALPAPRVGSIETHSGYASPTNSGQEIHLSIQQERQQERSDYQAEYKVSYVFKAVDWDFNVSGFADGFFDDEDHIEEIKTTNDILALRDKLQDAPFHPYLLQTKTYGYMWYQRHGRLPKLSICIASSRDGSEISVPVILDIAEYENWLKLRLVELNAEATEREERAEKRKEIAELMQFPFSDRRPGQQALMDSIEANIKEGKHSLIQAATGLGKTIGVLFPMLKDAFTRGQRVIYVTPKNSQHSVAEFACASLQKEHEIKTLTLTAKTKACLKDEMICNPEHCEFARDYYSKVASSNLVKVAAENAQMTGEIFKEIGEKFEVCPFELSTDCLDEADIVVADYNYVFSPRSLLQRLTTSKFGSTKKSNLVIDEAHNLPQRATGYFSPSLSFSFLNGILWQLPRNKKALYCGAEAVVKDCLEIFESYKPRMKGVSARITPDKARFIRQLESIKDLLSKYLQDTLTIKQGDPIVSLYNEWFSFSEGLQLEGDAFVSIFQNDPTGGALKIICCDASPQLENVYKAFNSVAAFSATLKPFPYYAKVSGFTDESSNCCEFVSPFEKEKRKLLVIPQVSTKFSDRASNYQKIADAIVRLTANKVGNYIAFFPSFAFLDAVHEKLPPCNLEVIKQEREWKKASVDMALAQMKMLRTPTLLFAVQGGVFAEGVDYPGDMLIGALIVGPPLPTFDLEREVLREYYENNHGLGFHYAYIYPAMAKVIQAAGRVIRSEEDRGLIVLMDKRFLAAEYAETMPSDWFEHSVHELVSQQISLDIANFWQQADLKSLENKERNGYALI